MTESAYIHIPFCKSKCNYCSFVSYSSMSLIEDYIKSLLIQIRNEYKGELLKTLYIGGGTPSLLDQNALMQILNAFKFKENPEITIEVNPNDISTKYAKSLLNIGINRISVGIQTFNDKILNIINRRHNSYEAKKSIEILINSGFNNISLDFIYGLPNQTEDDFVSDLKIALSYPVQHISLYGLKLDSDCYFGKQPPENLPDDDMQADMYLSAADLLTQNGFEHYEFSNFAKEGFYSNHNLNYWNAERYYGFGCSASGYINNVRYTNLSELEDYINNPLKKSVKNELSKRELLEEAIFLGFRKRDGIDVGYINNKFNIDFERKYFKILQKYSNYIRKTSCGYALNLNGILISNVILAEFIS